MRLKNHGAFNSESRIARETVLRPEEETTAYLTIKELSKTYRSLFNHRQEEHLEILDKISLTVKKGEFVTIFGPNGCGKTTFLKIIAGLEGYQRGRIEVDGKPPDRIKIGYIFQNYRDSLFPWRTNLSNLTIPLELEGMGKREKYKRAREFLKKLALNISEDSYPYQLSGGQQQLLSIIRALIYEPDVLLMDEPFSSLDFQTTLFMHDKLLDIWRKTGTTIIFVSHDINEAIYLADRVVLFSKRPARIIAVMETNLPRPRSIEIRETGKFFTLRNRILDLFKEEITDNLIFSREISTHIQKGIL